MPLKEPSLSLMLLGLTMLAVLGGSIIVWGLIFSRLAKREPVVPYEPRRPLPRGGIDILLGLVLTFIVFSIGLLVAHTLGAAEHSPTIPSSGAKQAAPSNAKEAAPESADPKGEKSSKSRKLGPNDLIAGMRLELIVLVLLVAAVRALAGATWRDLGFSFSRLGYDAALGCCAYLAAIVPLMALQWVLSAIFQQPYSHPIIEGYKHEPDSLMLTLTALSAVVVAPLCEELLFRVLLQGWFESIEATWQKRGLVEHPAEIQLSEPTAIEPMMAPVAETIPNPYASPAAPVAELVAAPVAPADTFVPKPSLWPILLSSLLFASMHLGQGLAPVSLFFLALVLGYVYQRTHRLWPSLIVHLLLNSGSIIVLWLSVGNGLPVGK